MNRYSRRRRRRHRSRKITPVRAPQPLSRLSPATRGVVRLVLIVAGIVVISLALIGLLHPGSTEHVVGRGVRGLLLLLAIGAGLIWFGVQG